MTHLSLLQFLQFKITDIYSMRSATFRKWERVFSMKKNTIRALLNAGTVFLLGSVGVVSPALAGQGTVSQESFTAQASSNYGTVHELTLLDGTKFAGTITGHASRLITIATRDGATIGIPVRLIGTFDGRPFSAANVGAYLTGDSALNSGGEPSGSLLLHDVRSVGDSTGEVNGSNGIATGASANDLVAALRSDVWERRSAAARELGIRGQWESAVIDALSAQLADTVMGPELPPVAAPDSSAPVKLLSPGLEAAKALAAMESRGFDELAHQMFSANPLIRQRAAFGLGETENKLCVPILLMALKDQDPQIRAAAAGALHFSEAMPQLMKAVDDNDEQVRAAAVASLGRIGEAGSGNALIAALGDTNSSVRSAAAGALGKIRSIAAVNPLAKLIVDPESDVRLSAVGALGRIRDATAVPPLIAALRDQDGAVVKAAATGLGDMRDPRAVEPLRTALQTCPESARGAVGISLKLLTEVPLLIGALDDRDTIVRRNVEYLLWLMTGKKLGFDKRAWADWFVSRSDAEGTKKSQDKISDTAAAPVGE
jgi:HEAT repeat protein